MKRERERKKVEMEVIGEMVSKTGMLISWLCQQVNKVHESSRLPYTVLAMVPEYLTVIMCPWKKSLRHDKPEAPEAPVPGSWIYQLSADSVISLGLKNQPSLIPTPLSYYSIENRENVIGGKNYNYHHPKTIPYRYHFRALIIEHV